MKSTSATITVALLALLATTGAAGRSATLPTEPADATVTSADVADATVASADPLTNYGATNRLTMDGRPTTVAYVQFAISVPAGQHVARAVFRCWAGSSNASGASLREVGNGWREGTITWRTAPTPDPAAAPVGNTGPVAARSWARADVTGTVRASGTYSFALSTRSATAWSCASRQNAGQHAPALDITTTPTTTPTTTAPASTTPPTTAPPTPTAASSTPAAGTSSAAGPATVTPTSSRPAPSSGTPAPASPSPAPGSTSSTGATTTAHASLTLPARGTFYYPWFPEAWKQGAYDPATHFRPSLGYYSTTSVLGSQVRSMIYGGFRFAASSWWGQGSKEDARLGPLLTAAHGSSLMIAPYYEAEGNAIAGVTGSPNPVAAQITADLNYLAAHDIADPNYLWIAGKPAIFVYGDGSDSCATASRWAQANAAATTHFYVVLKVFAGYQNCADQPANWHQYGPASEADSQGAHSYTISPGFDKFSESSARLARNPTRWKQDVHAMNCSAAAFKLVTTFNEWGEGTAVESATQWASASAQGTYLDALHDDQTC